MEDPHLAVSCADGIQSTSQYADSETSSLIQYSGKDEKNACGAAAGDDAEEDLPPVRRAIFSTIPMFMAYSGLVVLQGGLKNRLGLESGTNGAYLFGIAVGNLYLGNLIFRLFHNVAFSFLRPRNRVLVAYLLAAIAIGLIVFPYYVMDSTHLFFVFAAYLVGGMGVGTFESNLISSLTPLGHGTKKWALYGIPIGFSTISIGSFLLFVIFGKSDAIQGGLYGAICAANFACIPFYWFAMPDVPFEASNDTAVKFFRDLREWREWLPMIWKHCIAMAGSQIGVSLFASIVLYIYEAESLPLWPHAEVSVPRDAFLGVFFCCSFLGDFTSRKHAYGDKQRNPLFFLIMSVLGGACVLSKVCLIAPIGIYFVLFSGGSVYCQTTRYVDTHVPRRYNLSAISLWLFIGDLGSYAGSQMTQPLQAALGPVPLPDKPVPSTLPPTPVPTNTTNSSATHY